MHKLLTLFVPTLCFAAPFVLYAGDEPPRIGINVLGQVKHIDHFYLPQGSTVLDALACAGGASDTGNLTKAHLLRRGGEATEDVAVDLKAILAAKAPDIVLRNGDTLVIAERFLNVNP